MNYNELQAILNGVSEEQLKNVTGGDIMNLLNKNNKEVQGKNLNVTLTNTKKKDIFNIRTEADVTTLLDDAKKIRNSFKAMCAGDKNSKLELLLALKVQEVGLDFAAKNLAGEFEDETSIEEEIKTKLPQIEKTATNLLNKIKNMKLKAGRVQDKSYLVTIKKDIYESLTDCEDLEELKLTIRGLYTEYHEELGLPIVERKLLKEVVNTFIDLVGEDVKTGTPSIKENVKTGKVASRLNKVVRFYDNKSYGLDDLISILFKSEIEKSTSQIKDLLYKITGEAKYIK